MKKEYLTKEKYKELANELDWLQTARRQELADSLKDARSLGDLSENAEYHQAREDQANAEKRITDLEAILQNAVLIKDNNFDKVEVGASVTVRKKNSDEKVEYAIVGSHEVDMAQNKISTTSPLVQAMLGKKKGETFSFKSPRGVQDYTIIGIK